MGKDESTGGTEKAKGKDSEKMDANDYSRFKDLKDSDDEDEEENNDKEKGKEMELSVDETLVRAESCKLSGNSSFREKDTHEAIKFYEKGLKLLKPVEGKSFPAILEGHAVKRDDLLCSLLLNQAAACNRAEQWKECITACNKAESVVKPNDTANWVKLYFRRATAHNNRGDLDLAKKDFARVVKLDSKNRAAIREYNDIKRKLAAIKAKERKGFGKAFGAGGMYDDKEQERLKRIKKEKEEREKQRKIYEEEKKQLEEKGEPMVSFEEWEKVKKKEKEEEDKRKKEKEEKARKEREAKRAKEREERRLKELENPTTDEVELDDEDLAVINDVKAKGYCHFRREQSQEEKALLRRSLTPSKLSGDEAEENESGSEKPAGSAWNQAGTWEEKDVAQQAKKLIREFIKPISVVSSENGSVVKVKSISSIDGEAQIVMVNGKKGTLYDMSLEIKWEAELKDDKGILYDIDQDSDSDDEKPKSGTGAIKVVTGKLIYSDISNGVQDQEYESAISWNESKIANKEEDAKLRALLKDFQLKVRVCIADVIEKRLLE